MRSFLTMLGIIIGIASIIAIVSTIKGTSEQIKEQLIGAGNNTVKISLYNGDSEYESGWGSSSSRPPLLSQAQKAQVSTVAHVENCTFYYSNTNIYNIYAGSKNFEGGTAYGIDQNYLATNGYVIREGRKFSQRDYDLYHKVILLDSNAAENLFPGVSPVGQVLEINSDAFIIIGVVQQRDAFVPRINSFEDYEMNFSSVMGSVFVPDTIWPVISAFDEPQNLIIKADSTDNMSKAGKDVEKLLNSFLPTGKSVGGQSSSTRFEYRADDIMEQIRNTQQLQESTSNQLIWIAGISLLVGGIGVANIMLVSVTERTGEIGLKKAIGAKKKVILAQFLTEAAVLTSIGGIIGVAIGVVLAQVVSRVAGIPTAISLSAAGLAVAFSMLIGIVSGLLPSIKAANLDPIDALRSE